MSSSRETDAARLLRGMRERDAVFKMLDTNGTLQAMRSPLADIQSTVDKLKQPLFQDVLRTVQNGSAQRAIDLARQLTRQPPPPAGSSLELKPSSASVSPPVSIRTVSDLGAMIRKSRKAMKLNQTEFAAHAGVGRRFISELESGKGSLEFDKVIACARAAGIDMHARSRTS